MECSVDEWSTIFLEHPVMYGLASKLVWEITIDNQVTTFRPVEGEALCDVEHNPVLLPKNGEIKLVLKKELDDELI